jgi:hypothetical protein
MSEFFYEQTADIKDEMKKFCDKVALYRQRQDKLGKSNRLQIPIRIRNEEKQVIEIERCYVVPDRDEYNIRVKEKTIVAKPDDHGVKEFGGGELWIESTHKIKEDGTPLVYVFADSIDHWNDIMEQIGIKDKLKFVPEQNRKNKY